MDPGKPEECTVTERWLRDTVADMCGCDKEELHQGTRLSDIGLDSFGIFAIISMIETLCGIQFLEEEKLRFLQIKFFGDLASIVDLTGRGT